MIDCLVERGVSYMGCILIEISLKGVSENTKVDRRHGGLTKWAFMIVFVGSEF